MLEEVQVKYTSRVDKTFQSIKEIFNEKINKLSKFEKEMKELEKDVRLNYSNIIRLMDLEPFYEIIYRYNKKLNNIKSVFTEFKGKPDEIPEEAIRVKGIKSQLGFVTGFGRRLESYFADGDSFNSDHSSLDLEDNQRDKYPSVLAPIELEQQNLDCLTLLGTAPKVTPKITQPISVQTDVKGCELHIGSLTEKISRGMQTDKSARDRERDDDLKAQAEILIRSVDTLISSKEPAGQVHIIPLKELSVEASVGLGLTKSPQNSNTGLNQHPVSVLSYSPGMDHKQAKTITKSEIAKRIQAHFNNSASPSKGRSTSSNSGSKQPGLLGLPEEQSVSKSTSVSHPSGKPAGTSAAGKRIAASSPQGNNLGSMESSAGHSSVKPRLNKTAAGQLSSGHLGQSSSFGNYSTHGIGSAGGFGGYEAAAATPLASMIKSTSGGLDRHSHLLAAGKRDTHAADRYLSGSSSTKTEKLLMLYRKNKGPSQNGLTFGAGSAVSHHHNGN